MGRYHEVWVITRANNRPSIEESLAKEPLANVRWIYYDLPRWARFWKRGKRGVHLYSYLWQVGIYFVGKRLHSDVKFDVVHHATLGGFWYPSWLALLPVPFVWGPVGAGSAAPRAFWKEFSVRGKLNETLRVVALFFSRLDPMRGMMEEKASAILAVSSVTASEVKPRNQHKITLFSQVGFDSREFDKPDSSKSASRPFTLLSVGRLLHWKGFALAIKAFALFHAGFADSQYLIVGDGPEKTKLILLANSLGLSDCVRFLSTLSREDYLAYVRDSDVLLYPSLHEPGAFVIIEAMASGKPVVCLDVGEPALQVTADTGIKVPAASPEQVVQDLANALHKLATNPELRLQLGSEGKKRVQEHFDWDKKGQFMTTLYQSLATAEKRID
jgi:glycosyltransferase involved in cell wall biosynthesis